MMEGRGANSTKKMYGLIIVLIALQAAAIGLILRFTANTIERDKVLLDRTGAMMEEIFPGLKQDIGDVSRKATQIGKDISGLRDQVSRVDEHVGEVKDGVSQVGSRMEKMDSILTTFVGDTSGLIWGHSVNPYVLIALLTVIMAAIPTSTWLFARKRLAEASLVNKPPLSAAESLSVRLDNLHTLIERIRSHRTGQRSQSPELEKLMIETERLIRDARSDLDHIAPTMNAPVRKAEGQRNELN